MLLQSSFQSFSVGLKIFKLMPEVFLYKWVFQFIHPLWDYGPCSIVSYLL